MCGKSSFQRIMCLLSRSIACTLDNIPCLFHLAKTHMNLCEFVNLCANLRTPTYPHKHRETHAHLSHTCLLFRLCIVHSHARKMIHISSVYNILLAVSLEINNSFFWDLWGVHLCVGSCICPCVFAPICVYQRGTPSRHCCCR